MLSSDGFLAPASYLGADIALVGELVLYVFICVAVVAQRRGLYHWHDRIQTPVVLLNLVFIFVIMVLSLRYENVPSEFVERPFEPFYLVVVIHAVLGIMAQGLAIYCLLAGHKILPRKIGRLRYWMWATFIVWTAAVVMGVVTYYIWYIATPERPHLFYRPAIKYSVAVVTSSPRLLLPTLFISCRHDLNMTRMMTSGTFAG